MAGTTRTAYDGEKLHDGEHGKKCPSKNCGACHSGAAKPAARRRLRRTSRRAIHESAEGRA